jgi:hypothetical protein
MAPSDLHGPTLLIGLILSVALAAVLLLILV